MKSNEILKSQCIVFSQILRMANERFDLDLGGVNVNGILRSDGIFSLILNILGSRWVLIRKANDNILFFLSWIFNLDGSW